MDHAAERAVAVEVGRASAQHFDAIERSAGDAASVDPAAEGVVERHAVVEDEGAAGPAAPDAAEGGALGRRVRGAAARSPEEREAGHLAQHVVDGQGGRQLESARAEDDDAGRRLAEPLGDARTGDGDLVGERAAGTIVSGPASFRRSTLRRKGA